MFSDMGGLFLPAVPSHRRGQRMCFHHYTMPTKLEKTSLSGQVYILTRLVKYLVKCSYYTMPPQS